MKTDEKIAKESQRLMEQLTNLSESELSDLVLFHNKKYFEENNPKITDEAFDKLVEALRFVNPHARALSQIGHRDESGSNAKFGDDVVHQEPMLSLEKCYDDKTFFKWAQKITGDFVAMPKIDGVACSIVYSLDGKLIEASTRGDGKIGENITKNALLISDLPAELPQKIVRSMESSIGFLDVRGEIFLPISQFKKKFAETFTSPRNLAAGFLKLKEADRTNNNYLKFFPYDVRGVDAANEHEKFSFLEQLGFSMMPWKIIRNDSHAAEIYFDYLKKRSTFDFEIDGVVYRADSARDQARLGETAHHPRYALAYKFQGETAQTKLIGVEWSVARSGIITPIALVEPVFASGAYISRASLHNLRIFSELDLREHSLVEINRRGGVIPYLERVLSKKGKPIPIPDRCPSCHGRTIVDGDFLRCADPKNCREVKVNKLVHFCHVVGIEGLGEKIIHKLVFAGLLKDLADVFRLNVSELLTLERMGEVLAKKLINEIDSKRTIDLAIFVRALGIKEIGRNISELLASNFHTLSRIRSLGLEDLLAIHGIGESISLSLIAGLKEKTHEIDDLLKEVNVKDEEIKTIGMDTSHPLFGKSVMFTGKMAHLERKAAQEAVKKLGGKAPEAMSKNVDYLVIGDEGSPLLGEGKKSTKQKDAEKLISQGGQIKIITESEFMKLIRSDAIY